MAKVQITIENNIVTEVVKDGVQMGTISMANLTKSDADLDTAVANGAIAQAERDRIRGYRKNFDHLWDRTIVMEYVPGACVKINGVLHCT